MKLNTLIEASAELAKYKNWNNVIFEKNNKKIQATFIGVSDYIMSQNIWWGIEGRLPQHQFNNYDLENIEYWVAFTDNTIMNVREVLEDGYMKYLLEPHSLRHNIYLSENWSIPLRIPKGLHVRIILKEDTYFDLKVTNHTIPPTNFEYSISREKDGRYNILYNEIQGMAENIVRPDVSFRLTNSVDKIREIVVLFVDIINPSIH